MNLNILLIFLALTLMLSVSSAAAATVVPANSCSGLVSCESISDGNLSTNVNLNVSWRNITFTFTGIPNKAIMTSNSYFLVSGSGTSLQTNISCILIDSTQYKFHSVNVTNTTTSSSIAIPDACLYNNQVVFNITTLYTGSGNGYFNDTYISYEPATVTTTLVDTGFIAVTIALIYGVLLFMLSRVGVRVDMASKWMMVINLIVGLIIVMIVLSALFALI